MNDKKYAVLMHVDDCVSPYIGQKLCNEKEFDELKEKHKREIISIIGHIPIKFYDGQDVYEEHEEFIYFED